MGLTNLRRFSTTVIQDKSTTDQAQVPATVDIHVYLQGATASSAQIVTASGGTATVDVYDRGALVVNDTVKINTSASQNLTVTAVNSSVEIEVRNDGASDVSIGQGDRLVITSRRPSLWSETTGAAILDAAGETTTDSRGFVSFYLTELLFDYIATSGSQSALYIDEESGQLRQRRAYYNVMDFPSVQEAIASVPRGRKLYFPAEEGPYTPPSALGWDVEDAIEIFGDGQRIPEDLGFAYYGGASGKDSCVFNLVGNVASQGLGVIFRDIVFSGNGGNPGTGGTGDAIRLTGSPPSASSTTPAVSGQTNLHIEKVHIFYPGRSGVFLDGASIGAIVGLALRDVLVYKAGGHGLYMTDCHQVQMDKSSFVHSGGCGAMVNNSGDGFHAHACDFSDNGSRIDAGTATVSSLPDTFPGYVDANYNAGLHLGGLAEAHIHACNFENAVPTGNEANMHIALTIRGCNSTVVGANEFDFSAPTYVNSKSILVANGSIGCNILTNTHTNVETMVEIGSAANDYGNVVMPQFMGPGNGTRSGKVVFPQNGRNYIYVTDRTTITDIQNNHPVGLVLPNLSTALSAGKPALADAGATVRTAVFEGMLVYTSDAGAKKVFVLTAADTWSALN